MSHIVGGQAAASLAAKYQTLTEIIKADTAELTTLPGVGQFRALQIKAALELAGRLSREVLGDSPLLDTPESVAAVMREEARTCRTEVFHILLLNTRKRLIRKVQIATGTLDTLLVHAREVFCHAIVANASAVVLCHNHPSGQSDPSSQDIAVTRDLIRAGQLLKIEVLDHVIMGASTTERPKDYSSLRELGYFYAG